MTYCANSKLAADENYKGLGGKWGWMEGDAGGNRMVDVKQSIGKRYARMDEIGTPFCVTIDGETLKDQTVTIRHRDSMTQERINLSHVKEYLLEKLAG